MDSDTTSAARPWHAALRRGGVTLPVPAALVALAAAQWAGVAAFALNVPHNGWLFYHGGDSTWYYTSSWLLAEGHLPYAHIGYVWSLVFTPVALVAGPSLLAGLPAIVLVQVGVLLPLALISVYGIVSGIGGRTLGLVSAAAWAAVPFVALPLFVDSYREKLSELFLPQALGLSYLGDFPSMVFLLGATFFAFRAIDTRDSGDAIAAGLLTGLAVGLKPANALFLVAPAVAFPLARRWREAAGFAVALLPPLLTLALWKYRGLGTLPILTLTGERLAADVVAATVDRGGLSYYVRVDRSVLGENARDFRDVFWSIRLLEWAALAGAIALCRHSLAKAAFLVSWLLAFVVFKGAAPQASVESASFFRLLMPAFPAFVLLAASIPLVVPFVGHRLRPLTRRPREPAWRRRGLLLTLVAAALLPLAVVATARPLQGAAAMLSPRDNLYLPVEHDFRLRGEPTKDGYSISWRRPETAATKVFYRIYRSRAGADASCERVPNATTECVLETQAIATTRALEFSDSPVPGRYTYRVGMAADRRDDPRTGDVLLLSQAMTRTIP